jgi:DNA-binding MarR family transcriptional regulator
MARKADAKTTTELNKLFHDLMVGIGHTSGSDLVGVINETDLTFPQMIILRLLEQGQQTVSRLSEMVQLTPGAVSRLVDRMVRKGFVSRREGDDDRRQKTLSLTPAGRRLCDRLERARTGSFSAAMSELDSRLATELKDVLKRVVATLSSRPSTTER